MKIKFLTLGLLSVILTFGGFNATAQEVPTQTTFLVADGSSSGTYQQFLKEIVAGTPDSGIVFKEIPSSGAIENLDKLINNEVMGAFMHSDVLFHRNKNEPDAKLDSKFETILALFPEDVQFVALTTSKHLVGGYAGFGAKPIVIRNISDLGGLKVGCAGGGYITTSLIKLLSDIPYQIVKFDSGKDVLAALANGDIDAAEFTGAAPLPNLKDLGTDYKILPIDGSVSEKLKMVYRKSTVTYTKMNAQPVNTVCAQCLFVGKVYKSKKMRGILESFRKAFTEHLDDIKETPGNHKKWQDVDPDDHGFWPWMTLDDTNVAVKK